MKYFVANKELDFLRGYNEGAAFRNNRMEIADGADKAAFFSRMFDSHEEGMVWHRFTAEISDPDRTVVRFYIYSSETDMIRIDGKERKISEYLKDPSEKLRDKKKSLEPFLRKTISNCSDVLLFDVKGRYLFYLCEMYVREGETSYAGDIMISFPRKTWADFLPDIYTSAVTSSDFTERFLAVFQSVYEDLDIKIKESPGLLDPMWAERPMLEELAGWFGFRNLYLWPDDKLRELVIHANEIAIESGTVKCIGDVLEIYLGERPEVVECFKVAKSGSMVEQLEYGTDIYKYVINIKDKYLKSKQDYNALMSIISDNSPAHMSVRLRPVIDRDGQSTNAYLGINTGLATQDKEVTE